MTKSQELLIRILSTVLFVPFLIFSLFYEKTYSFPVIVALGTFWGITEFYTLARKTGFKPDYCIGFVLAFIVWYYTAFESTSGLLYAFPLLWMALLLGFFYQLIQRGVELPSAVANIGITVLGILYIAWPFSLLIDMQRMDNGGWYLMWLIFVTWFCDIGAYLVGSRIGKHKLCPHISPGKTVEGLIGGIVFSVLIALALDYVLISRLHLKFFSIPVSLVIAAVLILIGTAGDLAESVMKRQAGVKDSGNTYTGHGGMLDIVDSLLFTIPVYYYLFKLLV